MTRTASDIQSSPGGNARICDDLVCDYGINGGKNGICNIQKMLTIFFSHLFFGFLFHNTHIIHTPEHLWAIHQALKLTFQLHKRMSKIQWFFLSVVLSSTFPDRVYGASNRALGSGLYLVACQTRRKVQGGLRIPGRIELQGHPSREDLKGLKRQSLHHWQWWPPGSR